MATTRVGVSGWDYDPWAGDVYPDDLPAGERLSWMARRVDALEANGSFYALLTPDAYRSWDEDTPRRLRLAVKGSRFITHNKRLKEPREPVANFLASGPLVLGAKLGPFLWQLSDRTRFDPQRLRSFVDLLPGTTDDAASLARDHDDRVEDVHLSPGDNHRVRHVLEARHESFFCREAVGILRDAGVALAISHAGDWPLREELTAGFVYIRLHGAPTTYASGYGGDALDRWAERIRAWARGGEPDDPARITDRVPPRRKGRDVYVFFDNDQGGHAPRDAWALRERLGLPELPGCGARRWAGDSRHARPGCAPRHPGCPSTAAPTPCRRGRIPPPRPAPGPSPGGWRRGGARPRPRSRSRSG